VGEWSHGIVIRYLLLGIRTGQPVLIYVHRIYWGVEKQKKWLRGTQWGD
jgi:hypothetical protein